MYTSTDTKDGCYQFEVVVFKLKRYASMQQVQLRSSSRLTVENSN